MARNIPDDMRILTQKTFNVNIFKCLSRLKVLEKRKKSSV